MRISISDHYHKLGISLCGVPPEGRNIGYWILDNHFDCGIRIMGQQIYNSNHKSNFVNCIWYALWFYCCPNKLHLVCIMVLLLPSKEPNFNTKYVIHSPFHPQRDRREVYIQIITRVLLLEKKTSSWDQANSMNLVIRNYKWISFLAAARLKGFEHMLTFGPR